MLYCCTSLRCCDIKGDKETVSDVLVASRILIG